MLSIACGRNDSTIFAARRRHTGRMNEPSSALNPGTLPGRRYVRRITWRGYSPSVQMCAQLNNGVMSLLVEPVKRDLQLTDLQMSYLLGFSVVMFYVLIGIPAARLVDRHNRKWLLTVSIANLERRDGRVRVGTELLAVLRGAGRHRHGRGRSTVRSPTPCSRTTFHRTSCRARSPSTTWDSEEAPRSRCCWARS